MNKSWIESMRLRTLPVSVAGVFAGTGCAISHDCFRLLPALLCLLFAILAQVASNFANEYYDFKNGLDKKGRAGFRRGVTEGDISPEAMKRATYITLGAAATVGCLLLFYGGWWRSTYSPVCWPCSSCSQCGFIFLFGHSLLRHSIFFISGRGTDSNVPLVPLSIRS